MDFKNLLYIESEQEVNSGMVRVLLELQGIKAEVEEARVAEENGRIIVVEKKGEG